MRHIALIGGLILGGTAVNDALPSGFLEVDYSQVERKIAKEPAYTAPPRYALFIFDLKGEYRVWTAFDKSKADLPYYDVLYFDMNGNGDLTEPGERFSGDYDKSREAAGTALSIHVGKIPVPGTDLVHTNLYFSTTPKSGRKGFWFQMKWDGRVEVSGGYGMCGTDTTVYGSSPQSAPILRPTTAGPLAFAFWQSAPVTLPIGGAKNVNLVIGSKGSGPDTLSSLHETFLQPGKDVVRATLIAKDEEGKEIRVPSEIKEHC